MKHSSRFSRVLSIMLVFVLLVLAFPLQAQASSKYTVKKSAKVYQKASTSSKVIASRSKGDKVTVTAVKGKWVKVKSGKKTGYMLKSSFAKKSSSLSSKSSAKSSSKHSTKDIQQRLYKKGYLKAKYVTGKNNTATRKAIRKFQLVNGLSANGRANAKTVKKLFSSSAKSQPKVNNTSWNKSGLSSRFPKGKTATITALNSGITLTIRRVGGVKHADVEPATAKDTAKLKKIYNGKFSWDSKAVLLKCGSKYYAAAINGYPHGKQISKTNNYNGQFCLHLKDSKTHGTSKENTYHQKNITKVANYFS